MNSLELARKLDYISGGVSTLTVSLRNAIAQAEFARGSQQSLGAVVKHCKNLERYVDATRKAFNRELDEMGDELEGRQG